MFTLIFLIFVKGATSAEDVLPNVGFILKGYHLYHGNPLATQVTSDPGFRASIFSTNFSKNLLTNDDKYRIPNGMYAVHKVGCASAFSRDVMTNPQQYQNLLQQMIKTNYTGFDNSFTGSSDFQQVSNMMSSSQLLVSQILCSQYELELDIANPPNLSKSFVEYVKDLYGNYQRNRSDIASLNLNIHRMLNKYGTHFVTKIEMGSRYSFHSTIDASTLEALKESGLDVRSGAVLSLNRRMGLPLKQNELSKAQLFDSLLPDSLISSSFTHFVGGRLDLAASKPIPLYYEVERIDRLFVKRYMKNAGINYKGVGTLLDEYFQHYCENEKKMGTVDVCAENSRLSVSEGNFKIVFPEYPVNTNPATAALFRDKLAQQLSAFTVAWWMKSPPFVESGSSKKRRTFLSYNDNFDILKISVASELEGGCLVIVLDDEKVLEPKFCHIPVDNTFHHYVFTWSNIYGRWQLYVDGNLLSGGSSGRNLVINSGGYFMIGQDQKKGTPITNSCKAFEGEIAYLNIWSFKVNGVEAARMATQLSDLEGNVVSWDQRSIKLQGKTLGVKPIVNRSEFFKF